MLQLIVAPVALALTAGSVYLLPASYWLLARFTSPFPLHSVYPLSSFNQYLVRAKLQLSAQCVTYTSVRTAEFTIYKSSQLMTAPRGLRILER
jgi:hypothetical protein